MEVVQAVLDLPWWVICQFAFKFQTACFVAALPFVAVLAVLKALVD